MSITRRIFLRNSALAVVGTAAVPSFLARAAFGAVENGGRTKRLVVIFQRGAADGLNICNGNRIDDRKSCENRYCQLFGKCGRKSLK